MKNKKLLLASSFLLLASGIFAQINPNFNYTQTCYGNQTTLLASSALLDTSIKSWIWHLPDNGTHDTIQYGKMIIYLFSPKDTNAVKLKITPNVGTPDSITKNVIIDPLPQVNFFVNNLCQGKNASYISQSTISSGSITLFSWDFHNDGSGFGTGDTAIYNNGTPGIYQTKLTCTSNKGCQAFAVKTTQVYPTPTVSFNTTNFCLNNIATFTNTSIVTNLDHYLWNFGDGSQGTTSTNGTHIYATTGNYSVTLIAVTQSGCRDTTSLPTTIFPLPVVSISGNTPTCMGNAVILNASGGTTYSWNNGATTGSITDVPTATTTYSVTATNPNGCSNTTNALVTVNPLPMVSITSPAGRVLYPNSNVILVANGATSYQWYKNHISITGAINDNIKVDSSGIYSVTGTDMNSCTAKDSISIVNESSDTVAVTSNILTPNGDGINDVLTIFNISAYQNCQLTIYNMWNDKVFSTDHYNNNWDGRLNGSGNVVPSGPYYYIIKCDDKPILKGNINILH